jgi:cytochrome c biogenesis protein CcmG/thiol:disulfide interchange protein DsbE
MLFRSARIAAVCFVSLLFVLLVWKLVHERGGRHLVSLIREGKRPPAPMFDLPVIWNRPATWPEIAQGAVADGRINPRELRGHPMVINFWASWCGPCKDEAPRLVASARQHAGSVAFLGIDVQDFKGDARKFLRKFGTNYVSVRDGGGSTSTSYGLTGVPETYWLDRRGRIVAQYPGEVSRDQLEQGIAEASRQVD